MNEFGLVVELKEDKALVNIKRKSACGKCKACDLGNSDAKELNILVDNSLNAQVGDSVNLLMETPDFLKAAMLVYLLPLITLFVGIMVSSFVLGAIGINNEVLSVIFGLIAMAGSFLFVRKKDKEMGKNKKYSPIMVEIK